MGKRYISEEGIELLRRVQAGDSLAQEQLIILIKDKFMIGRIYKYLSKNRVVDNDDIKQEFLIGAALAFDNAKMDIGDPLEYILYRGTCRVKSYIRKHILQSTFQICRECGHKSRLNRFGTGYICKRCGATHVETFEVNDYDETLFDVMQCDGKFEDDVVSSMIIADFKNTLKPGTNVFALFELIESGVDRDNPAIPNYLKYIAQQWGGCTEQNVLQTLNKLRDRLQRFIRELEEAW